MPVLDPSPGQISTFRIDAIILKLDVRLELPLVVWR